MDNEKFIKEVTLAFEKFSEAIQEFADILVEAFKPVVEAFLELCQELYPVFIWIKRYQLYLDLKSWYIPDKISWWLAEKWPVRFLPNPRAGP